MRAHSIDTETSVHRMSELNTTTSDTDGSDASPSVTLASGMPISTRLLKMVPTPKIDCCAPSMRNTRAPTTRAIRNVSMPPPKYAMSSRASTAGSREKSLISRNRNAGTATANTNRVSASETDLRPVAPARQCVADEHQQEERCGEGEKIEERPCGGAAHGARRAGSMDDGRPQAAGCVVAGNALPALGAGLGARHDPRHAGQGAAMRILRRHALLLLAFRGGERDAALGLGHRRSCRLRLRAGGRPQAVAAWVGVDG